MGEEAIVALKFCVFHFIYSHVHPADREEVTESPLRMEQSTVKPHMHMDTTTSWQPLQGLTSVQSVTFSDVTTRRDFENTLHALKSSDGVIFPINQGLGREKHPNYPHVIPESAVHRQKGSEYKTQHQNASDNVTARGSVSRINVSYPVRATDSQTDQQRQTGGVNFPLYILRSSEKFWTHEDLQHDTNIHGWTRTTGTTEHNNKNNNKTWTQTPQQHKSHHHNN